MWLVYLLLSSIFFKKKPPTQPRPVPHPRQSATFTPQKSTVGQIPSKKGK